LFVYSVKYPYLCSVNNDRRKKIEIMKITAEQFNNEVDTLAISMFENIDESKNGTTIDLISVTEDFVEIIQYRIEEDEIIKKHYNRMMNTINANVNSTEIKYIDLIAQSGVYEIKINEMTSEEFEMKDEPEFLKGYKLIGVIN